jgi:hypothetical protein
VGVYREWLAVTEPQSEYAAWVAAYEQAWHSPSAVSEMVCPSCGEKSLRLVFVVEDLAAESGTAIFWCDSCRRGLLPVRAPIPAGAEKVLRGQEKVPNYALVIDES